mgnify:CR=1 FL=1
MDFDPKKRRREDAQTPSRFGQASHTFTILDKCREESETLRGHLQDLLVQGLRCPLCDRRMSGRLRFKPSFCPNLLNNMVRSLPVPVYPQNILRQRRCRALRHGRRRVDSLGLLTVLREYQEHVLPRRLPSDHPLALRQAAAVRLLVLLAQGSPFAEWLASENNKNHAVAVSFTWRSIEAAVMLTCSNSNLERTTLSTSQ